MSEIGLNVLYLFGSFGSSWKVLVFGVGYLLVVVVLGIYFYCVFGIKFFEDIFDVFGYIFVGFFDFYVGYCVDGEFVNDFGGNDCFGIRSREGIFDIVDREWRVVLVGYECFFFVIENGCFVI